jgi:DNA repair protein RadC
MNEEFFEKGTSVMSDQEHFQLLLDDQEGSHSGGFDPEGLSESLLRVALEDQDAFLQLSLVDGVGYRTMCRLIQRFGSATATLKATLGQISQVERVGPKIASSIRDSAAAVYATEVLKICKDQHIDLLFPGDPRIPSLL